MKCEVNQAKTRLQFQGVDTKKDLLTSASASLALNLVTLNVNNDQLNDIKIIKRKANRHLGKYWKNMEISLTHLVAFLENYI